MLIIIIITIPEFVTIKATACVSGFAIPMFLLLLTFVF